MFNIELRYRNNAVLQIEILFERNGLEFLQNDKVEVFSKKIFCLFLKRKYLTFRRLENASLIFFLMRLYNLFDPFIFILHIPPPN